MNFVERVFHLDPDAGSGLFEIVIIVTVASLMAMGARIAIRRAGRARR
jgi:hypothetical protein